MQFADKAAPDQPARAFAQADLGFFYSLSEPMATHHENISI